MYLNTLVIIFVTIGAVTPLKFEEFKFPGVCPKVKHIVDLEFGNILGWWYKCFSTWDSNLCFNNDGQTAYAHPFNSTVAGVVMCCRDAANPTQVNCSPEVGTGFIRPLAAGRFNYEFDGQSYLTLVLDADENTLITYGCNSKSQRGRGRNDLRDEQIYVYSRSYERCKSLKRRGRRVLKQNGISGSNLKPVKHGSLIPYTPVPCPRIKLN